MLDLRTGNEMTRRETIKGGLGLAAILAAGKAPAMLLGARGVAFGKEPLPYDAEVEWLQGDGMSYINTGLKANSNLSFNTKLSTFWSGSISILMGARVSASWSSETYAIVINGYNPSNNYVEIRNDIVFMSQSPEIRASIQFPSYYEFNFSNDSHNSTLKWMRDGVVLDTYTGLSRSNINLDLYLFACNTSGSLTLPCKSYFYWFKGTDGISTIDLIPVRIGSGSSAVGCMYDRVSKRLFGNAGTGKFNIGPDKN